MVAACTSWVQCSTVAAQSHRGEPYRRPPAAYLPCWVSSSPENHYRGFAFTDWDPRQPFQLLVRRQLLCPLFESLQLTTNGMLRRTNAVNTAMAIVNGDPAVLPGTELDVRFMDTRFRPAEALIQSAFLFAEGSNSTVALNSTNSTTFAILGDIPSPLCRAIQVVAMAYRLPQVSFSCRSRQLAGMPFFFRTGPSDDENAACLLSLMGTFGWKHVALLGSADTDGYGFSQAFANQATAAGISVVANEVFQPGGGSEGRYMSA